MSLYTTLLAKNVRPASEEQMIDLCLQLLTREKLTISEKSTVAVILCYKVAELKRTDLAEFVLETVTHCEDVLLPLMHADSIIGSLREDPDHLYISLLTAKWHLFVVLGYSVSEVFKSVSYFVANDKKHSVMTSQNISRTFLFYGYIKAKSEDVDSLTSTKNLLASHLNKCFHRLVNEGVARSTYVGDLINGMKCLQCLYAGIDSLDSNFKGRLNVWSDDAVFKFASRVKTDEFEKSFKSYLSTPISMFRDHDNQ